MTKYEHMPQKVSGRQCAMGRGKCNSFRKRRRATRLRHFTNFGHSVAAVALFSYSRKYYIILFVYILKNCNSCNRISESLLFTGFMKVFERAALLQASTLFFASAFWQKPAKPKANLVRHRRFSALMSFRGARGSWPISQQIRVRQSVK